MISALFFVHSVFSLSSFCLHSVSVCFSLFQSDKLEVREPEIIGVWCAVSVWCLFGVCVMKSSKSSLPLITKTVLVMKSTKSITQPQSYPLTKPPTQSLTHSLTDSISHSPTHTALHRHQLLHQLLPPSLTPLHRTTNHVIISARIHTRKLINDSLHSPLV